MSVSNVKQKVEDRAIAICEPLLAAEQIELIEVEFVREREGWTLRLFIDTPHGVGVEDCTRASHAVDTALEVEDVIPSEYHLEVSSPGLNRPLKKPEHFRRVQDKTVKIKTFGPVGSPPRRNLTGTLKVVGEQGITVEVQGAGPFEIAFKDIAKANLEFEF